MPSITVLTLNAGSSSLKASLVRGGERLAQHAVDADPSRMGDAFHGALSQLTGAAGGDGIDVVGHRIVHGGPDHHGPALVDDALLASLHALVPLAPLHQPAGLLGIDAARAELPGVPQVASFDTAFHRTLPEVAQQLAVPTAWTSGGVRRYGFHGLSYQHVVDSLDLRAGSGRVVVAHLGSGVSLAALGDGCPVDTTMGLTPAGGAVMAGRSGDLDPGVLTWALRTGAVADADALDTMLDRDSGLRGVSGTTGDMRELLAARARGDERATLAVAVFVHSVRKHVGALTTTLGGIDRLVFTGGIGEHSDEIRTEVTAGLAHLGPPPVSVVPTDEEAVIAREAAEVLLAFDR